MPKQHLEQTLHNLVRTHRAREAAMVRARGDLRGIGLSAPMEPRVDCIGLERVNRDKSVVLHVVSTLERGWQSLEYWLTNDADTQLRDASIVGRVLAGVLGSLRDLRLSDQRPCRVLYADDADRPPKLSLAFLVHKETGETMSLLPYVSMPRIYRASLLPQDEAQFARVLKLALGVLNAGTRGIRTASDGSLRDTIVRFCNGGPVDEDEWTRLMSTVAGGVRRVSLREPPSAEWLGPASRTKSHLEDRFAWLTSPPTSKEKKRKGDRANEGNGVGEVCLLEVLRDSELTRRGPPGTLPELCDALCAFLSRAQRQAWAAAGRGRGAQLAEPSSPPVPGPSSARQRKRTNETQDCPDVAQKFIEDLNSHLSQGSQESTCAETSIQRTTTYRDEDLPSSGVGGRDRQDPGARIRWEIADNLVLTSREIAYYDMQMDEEAERTTASSGSVLTAGGMSLEGEEDLCSSDINPFFSRTSAVNRTPDTDVLQRAVEMYLPEGIPREVEEMYQEYHRTWSPDRSGSVDEAYRGESRTSASERSATSVSGSIFGDRASSERFRSERPSATGARVLDEPSLEEPPQGPDPAELIEGMRTTARPSRGSGPAGGAPVRLRPRERSPTRPHLARQPNEVEIEGAHKGGAGSLEPRALPQDDILGLRRHQDFTQASFGAARPRISRLRESPQSRTAQTSTRWHLG
ncbi:hypothetical protein Q5P01_000121 [Channa striata]|uniref:Uncharacterized protein n=1 Tax=Channa striata TaxID=64152 RepID=A0AA88LED6_CHASR|nr:hypothetical protein Q5P01_000121 [Channa striata]